MSTGFAAIPLLKAAPEPTRSPTGSRAGPGAGLELCLAPAARRRRRSARASDRRARSQATEAAGLVAHRRGARRAGRAAHSSRVDRLDDEARACIERSADFAAAIGSPVLTIHLFAPLDPESSAAAPPLDETRSSASSASTPTTCLDARRRAADRERAARCCGCASEGSSSPRSAGTGATCVRWRERVPELGFTFDTSHAGALPIVRGRLPIALRPRVRRGAWARALRRGARARAPRWRTSRTRTACSARACPTAAASSTSTRSCGASASSSVHRRGDQRARPRALAGHEGRATARSSACSRSRQPGRARRAPPPAPATGCLRLAGGARRARSRSRPLLELQERFGGRRVLITGGGGSIGRALDHVPAGFRPEPITLLDGHEASLTADRRARGTAHSRTIRYVLCDVRDPGPDRAELARGAAGRRLPPRRVQARRLGRGLSRGVRGHEPAWELERAARRRPGRGRHGRRRLDRQGGARRELLRPHEALHGAAHRIRGAPGRRRRGSPCASSTCLEAPAARRSSSSARRAAACR